MKLQSIGNMTLGLSREEIEVEESASVFPFVQATEAPDSDLREETTEQKDLADIIFLADVKKKRRRKLGGSFHSFRRRVFRAYFRTIEPEVPVEIKGVELNRIA